MKFIGRIYQTEKWSAEGKEFQYPQFELFVDESSPLLAAARHFAEELPPPKYD